MHLVYSFGKRHVVKKEVKVHMVNDSLHMIDKDTCGIYQLYFYVNLFNLSRTTNSFYKKLLALDRFFYVLEIYCILYFVICCKWRMEPLHQYFLQMGNKHNLFKVTIFFYKKLLALNRI